MIYSVTLFLINLSFNITVLHSFLSSIFNIANSEISSTNDASFDLNLFYFGLSTICSFEKNGITLFRKLKQDSHVSITPSSSKIFFMPKSKSTFAYISDTKVNTVAMYIYYYQYYE